MHAFLSVAVAGGVYFTLTFEVTGSKSIAGTVWWKKMQESSVSLYFMNYRGFE